MGYWNINGLSYTDRNNPNYVFKLSAIKGMDQDILCLSETFLRDDQRLEIPDYTWIGQNRTVINRRATRGSGGVGILIQAQPIFRP